VTNVNANLELLKVRACTLACAAESLASLLDQEANRLKRGDQIERLHRLRYEIARDLETARQGEERARSGETMVTVFDNVSGLATRLIAKGSNNNSWRVMSDYLLAAPAHRNLTFGTVLVAIGPKGLPDDVWVVSVSCRARESHRPESEIIKELRSGGNLPIGERSFPLLIDRLSKEILNGELSLPISVERLSLLIPRQVRLVQVLHKPPLGPENKG
jgi:hypothetical protein